MTAMNRPPNIVWMVADHQAYANRPPVAANFPVQARLAREGMRFERAYTVLPICSPARASMLTGLYPHAHGLTENDGRFGGRPGLDPSDWLVHGPLLEAGYRCAWFGKWHLDNKRSARDYGFEGFSLPGYGYPYATPEYRTYLKRAGLAPPAAVVEMPGESGLPGGTRINLTEVADWFDYEAGSALLDSPADTHEAFFLASLAEDWLGSIGDTPFFLRIDPWGPHPPYIVAEPYRSLFEQDGIDLAPNFDLSLEGRPEHHRTYRDYWGATLGLDASGWRRMAMRALQHGALVEAALGRVLDALDRAGLTELTLVVFCADHGDAVASNGGVSNKGSLMVEETMRIPLLVRGPGVACGATCDRIVANIDLAPTILQYCGVGSGIQMHGESLSSLLRDPTAAFRRGLMAEHYGLHEPDLQRAYYEASWKLVVQENGFEELYDLKTDRYELHNLASVPEHAVALDHMRAGLHRAMFNAGDCETRLSSILNRLSQRD